jgi:hypothetical protein
VATVRNAVIRTIRPARTKGRGPSGIWYLYTPSSRAFKKKKQRGRAAAKIEISKNGKMVYTDYLSLLKFEDGWRIVAKVYHAHPRQDR